MTDLPFVGFLLRAFYIFQDPGDLGSREIGRQVHPCLLADQLRLPLAFHPLADICRAGALPYDRLTDRLPSLLIPGKGGLPLIADAKSGDLVFLNPGLFHQTADHLDGIMIDLGRVMGDPAFLIDDLLMGLIGPPDQAPALIEEKRLGPLCALIDTDDILL